MHIIDLLWYSHPYLQACPPSTCLHHNLQSFFHSQTFPFFLKERSTAHFGSSSAPLNNRPTTSHAPRAVGLVMHTTNSLHRLEPTTLLIQDCLHSSHIKRGGNISFGSLGRAAPLLLSVVSHGQSECDSTV